MREYNQKILTKVFCNKCSKELLVENGILKEGCFCANQSFGYFSDMDGEKHMWDLCEECYRQLIDTFLIPATKQEETELL